MTLSMSHRSSLLGFPSYAMKLSRVSGELSEIVEEPRSDSEVNDNRFILGPLQPQLT